MKRQSNWRVIPYTKGFFQISSIGAIRCVNRKSKVYRSQSLLKSSFTPIDYTLLEPDVRYFKVDDRLVPYPIIKYETEVGIETKAVSTLMYEAFHGIYNLDPANILYLDGNHFNHSLANMVLCEKSDRIPYLRLTLPNQIRTQVNYKGFNPTHAYGITGKGVFVTEYEKTGERVRVHTGISMASRSAKMTRKKFNQLLLGEESFYGLDKVFKLGRGPYLIDTHLLQKNQLQIVERFQFSEARRVCKYSKQGQLCGIYNNIYDASISNRVEIVILEQLLHEDALFKEHAWFYDDRWS